MRHLSLLLLASLASCARDGKPYPSLSPRPIERLGFEEPAERTSTTVTVDPKLDLDVTAAGLRLDKAVGDFTRARARAEATARSARGAAAGSDAWIDAQTALAELDGLRAETSEIVSDLEQLAVDRAATLAPAYPTLERERARAAAALDEQSAAIARIGATLTPA